MIVIWLRFGRGSVYNTKAVCANAEFVNYCLFCLSKVIMVLNVHRNHKAY